jgi:protein TonB
LTSRTAYRAQQRYVLRMMGCLVLALSVMIGLVHLWPSWSTDPDVAYSAAGSEVIHIEAIQPTRQSLEQRPPPPAPLPPVVVPDDIVTDIEPLDFTDTALPIEEPGEDDERQEGTSRQATSAQRPDVNARLLRYAEPEYPRAARRRGVEAEVVIEVDIDPQGRVQSAKVVRRMLLGGDGAPPRVVSALDYGLEEAALAAARRCLFRPARAGGEPVSTRTTLTIRFGD